VAFAKAHGLGNDFLLVTRETLGDAEPGAAARHLCDRHTGIGADGLVILGNSSVADALFRIYNSDGSEAGLSGNALRCAAAWILEQRGEYSSGMGVSLETRVGRRELEFIERRENVWMFRAEMGEPKFAASDVPFRPPQPPQEPIVGFLLPLGDDLISATILNMGNPQCIVFVDDWSTTRWAEVGAELERHPWFPDRANIGFVHVLARNRIEARFWERGAGHTLSSGTGSCACAVAGHLENKTGRRVTVVLERGEMEVHWRDDGMVELTGPAVIVAEGTADIFSD
jgi:diaminopimelate epimerase